MILSNVRNLRLKWMVFCSISASMLRCSQWSCVLIHKQIAQIGKDVRCDRVCDSHMNMYLMRMNSEKRQDEYEMCGAENVIMTSDLITLKPVYSHINDNRFLERNKNICSMEHHWVHLFINVDYNFLRCISCGFAFEWIDWLKPVHLFDSRFTFFLPSQNHWTVFILF